MHIDLASKQSLNPALVPDSEWGIYAQTFVNFSQGIRSVFVDKSTIDEMIHNVVKTCFPETPDCSQSFENMNRYYRNYTRVQSTDDHSYQINIVISIIFTIAICILGLIYRICAQRERAEFQRLMAAFPRLMAAFPRLIAENPQASAPAA